MGRHNYLGGTISLIQTVGCTEDLPPFYVPADLSHGDEEWTQVNFADQRFRRANPYREPLRPKYVLSPGTECDVRGRHVCATIPLIHWAHRHQ